MLNVYEKIFLQTKILMTNKKIYLNKASEGWIVDRFRKEWYQNQKEISTKFIQNSNIIWLIAPWTWKKINKKHLKNKKVVCTIHHIDEDKFNGEVKEDFYEREEYVDIYHAISKKTEEQLLGLTTKKIETIPFWVNQKIWYQINNKNLIKEKYKLNKKDYLIGSFQRDTEGDDLISPKLSKGPDQFLEIVKYINDIEKNAHVILTGKRRGYLIENLKNMKIKYSYYEMVNFKKLNELYNCLDLYIVSSRFEGGPQAIVECGISKVPIISTDVGIASNILAKESIFNMSNYKDATPNINEAYKNSLPYTIPAGFDNIKKLFQ